MMSSMGRPREHDARTATALLEAGERALETGGAQALSVRGVAEEVGTTTRAVYSLFGSKDGLIAALGVRAFEMLGAAVAALPSSDDPVADLVEAGVAGFRRFAIGHPVLFRIGLQQTPASAAMVDQVNTARVAALATLLSKQKRLQAVGGLGGRTPMYAAWEFHALCEGLATLELRGALRSGDAERIWRDALTALAIGFGASVVDSSLSATASS